jgi:hypothetical protein
MTNPLRGIQLVLLYVVAVAGVIAPMWAAAIVELGVSGYGIDYIESFGPVVPSASRYFAEHLGWFITGPKVLSGVGAVAAFLVHKYQRESRSRFIGLLTISVLGYHVALMCAGMFFLMFYVLPRAANGA